MIDCLDAIVDSACLVETLPSRLRSLHFDDSLGKLLPISDPAGRARRIHELLRDEGPMWAAGSQVRQEMLRVSMVVSQMSNPGSRELSRFFALVGVDDLAAECLLEGADLGTVNAIVMRRNAVAHGDQTVTCTWRDIDNFLTTSEELCYALDVVASRAVMNVTSTPTRPW